MAKKTTKKVDVKAVAKNEVMAVIINALTEKFGETAVHSNSADYGFTKGTVVVNHPTCDIQIKPITPKAGVTRYEVEEEDGE